MDFFYILPVISKGLCRVFKWFCFSLSSFRNNKDALIHMHNCLLIICLQQFCIFPIWIIFHLFWWNLIKSTLLWNTTLLETDILISLIDFCILPVNFFYFCKFGHKIFNSVWWSPLFQSCHFLYLLFSKKALFIPLTQFIQ